MENKGLINNKEALGTIMFLSQFMDNANYSINPHLEQKDGEYIQKSPLYEFVINSSENPVSELVDIDKLEDNYDEMLSKFTKEFITAYSYTPEFEPKFDTTENFYDAIAEALNGLKSACMAAISNAENTNDILRYSIGQLAMKHVFESIEALDQYVLEAKKGPIEDHISQYINNLICGCFGAYTELGRIDKELLGTEITGDNLKYNQDRITDSINNPRKSQISHELSSAFMDALGIVSGLSGKDPEDILNDISIEDILNEILGSSDEQEDSGDGQGDDGMGQN